MPFNRSKMPQGHVLKNNEISIGVSLLVNLTCGHKGLHQKKKKKIFLRFWLHVTNTYKPQRMSSHTDKEPSTKIKARPATAWHAAL